MKKTLTIIAAVALAIYLNPQAIKAQTCATCPGNTVTGASASALGSNNTVSGTKSTAIGNDNIISSGFGFIAGAQSIINSSSTNSYIIGGFNTIFTGSQESYVFGSASEARASRVMLIGHRLKSGSTNQIIIGAGPVGGFLTSNKMHSLAVGFKSTFPTFFVSESPASDRTGKVSIGNTTDPQAKLHIRADAAEDASLLLEATGTNKISSFIMAGGQAYLGTASNNHSLSFVTGGTNTRMFINAANGNIAIGNNTDPQARLHIKAEGTQDAGILLEASGTGKSAGIFFTKSAVNIGTLDKDQPIAFFTAGTDLKMKITPEGNVGIGVASPLYKLHVAGNAKFDNQVVIDAGGLYVNGEVKAKKFHASISPFPDFVFEPGYKLLSINEVESFINQNGHLPGVPNAAQVEQNGIELGEMNALLLQKIEELTLYIIAQDKKIQALENAAIAK
jgi:hypothetical protein